MLDLNDVQEGVLNVAFRVADENGLALIDMKDLRAMLDAIVPYSGKKGADADLIRWRDPQGRAELRQCDQSDGRNHPAPACWCWKTRAAPSSSASRRWR